MKNAEPVVKPKVWFELTATDPGHQPSIPLRIPGNYHKFKFHTKDMIDIKPEI
jgi:hypothetical protein